MRRLSFFTFCLFLSISAGASAQSCAPIPDTAVSYALKLTGGAVPDNFYKTAVSIPGGESGIDVVMDTGSTGIVVSSSKVPAAAFAASTQDGQILYNSSNKFFGGKYVKTPVIFQTEGGGSVQTTAIDVLAVSCTCGVSQTAPTNKAKPDPARCSSYNGTPPSTGATKTSLSQCTAAPPSIAMMGVGFDRGGRSAALNPFLNLTAPTGKTIHPGYIISKAGVTLGLTAANSQGFKTIQLQPNKQLPGTEWLQLNACATVAAPGGSPSAKLCGGMLMDTGIDFMFLSFNASQRPTGSTTPSVGPYDGASRTILTPGWTMTFSAVDQNQQTALQYTQSAVQTNVTPTPQQTVAVWAGATAPVASNFMNTGRRLLYSAAYLFDQQCGKLGFSAY
jgi:hypothetical protein